MLCCLVNGFLLNHMFCASKWVNGISILAHIYYMSINYLYQLYDGTWQLFSQWPINFQFWAQRALNITIIREKRNCTYKMVHTHIWTCNVTYHLWGGPCPTPRLVGIIGLLSPGTLDHVLPYDCPIYSTDSFSGRLLVRKSATNNFFLSYAPLLSPTPCSIFKFITTKQ